MNMRHTTRAASDGVGMGWAATTTLLGGLLMWGGVGWLLDLWWGTRFATPVGVIVGLGLGVYAVVMRYGREPPQPQENLEDLTSGADPASFER